MKLLLLSDLHLELGASFTLPAGLDFDAVVLAGDIESPGHKAVHWAQRKSTFGGKPVVLVAGNHEFYGRELRTELEAMRAAAEGSNVHLLDRGVVVIDGVRFIGCMLWTDFQLPIRSGSTMDTDVGHALLEANQGMNDFWCIHVTAPATRESRYREFKRQLRAEDTLAMHWVDRDWLRRELRKPFDGPTVVVTHHAPSSESVAEKYDGDKLTPAFVSHLPDEFFEGPELWLHGHTHTAADYIRRRCRVVSNPRGGYRLRNRLFENHQFNPGLIIETAPRASYEQAVDAYVAADSEDSEEARLACQAHLDELSARADMADTAAAATLAGVAEAQLVCWASVTPPLVIAIRRAEGWRFPRWQFEPGIWPVARQLTQAIGGSAIAALNWLETPQGAFGGRTPRAALEQGESPDRVLALASAED